MLDRFIRNHTREQFGPVRSVEPKLVFEVAFDAIFPSSRHKSGIAMRFPRIHRIRWDKPAVEADTLATAKASDHGRTRRGPAGGGRRRTAARCSDDKAVAAQTKPTHAKPRDAWYSQTMIAVGPYQSDA